MAEDAVTKRMTSKWCVPLFQVCVVVLWIVVLSPHSNAEPVYRTRISDGRICSLTGRWLSFDVPDSQMVRAWIGILEGSSSRTESTLVKQRNAFVLSSGVISSHSLNQVAKDLRAEERLARVRHCHSITPRWFDVAPIETKSTDKPSRFRWAVDFDIDGSLDDEAWHEIDQSAVGTKTAANPLQFDLPECRRHPSSYLRAQKSPSLREGREERAGRVATASESQLSINAENLSALPSPEARPSQREGDGNSVPRGTNTVSADVPPELQRMIDALHRLDQVATRKQSLSEIIAAADNVVAHVDQQVDSDNFKTVLVDALYRKGRALGYKELPDVVAVNPVKDPVALQRSFEDNFKRLDELVDTIQPEYILLRIRRERRRNRRGVALDLVERYRQTHPKPVWHFKKRFDLLSELGATYHAHQAAAELWLHAKMPVRPVPVLFRMKNPLTSPAVWATADGSWIPKPPFRDSSLSFRPVNGAAEAVVWLEPGTSVSLTGFTAGNGESSFRITNPGGIFEIIPLEAAK